MKFIIFGKQVPVTFDDSIAQTGLEGVFDPVTWTIRVDKGSENKLQTTIHEFLHATWFRLGLIQIKVSEDTQELIVENLATAIAENFETLLKIYKRKP